MSLQGKQGTAVHLNRMPRVPCAHAVHPEPKGMPDQGATGTEGRDMERGLYLPGASICDAQEGAHCYHLHAWHNKVHVKFDSSLAVLLS